MGRIHDILSKAERDGTARRTRPVGDEYAARPADEDAHARSVVDAAGPSRAPSQPIAAVASDLPRTASVTELPRAARAEADGFAAGLRSRHAQFVEAHEPAIGEVTTTPVETTARAVADLNPLLVAALAPTSLAAEQYRSLRTRLKRAESGRLLRTIAVTSPSKGDGKSLTASNLALTMAQEFQDRVLLVDADLRRPAVHRLFGIAEGPGLSDVLMNLAELDQALVMLPDYHLTVLPAGVPPGHPAELLGSLAMRRVLDALRTRFDRVLIDVPPVAPLADLHILAPLLDGVLMIVRAGVTPKPAIESALSGLDASKVLGLVLNEAGDQHAERKGYGGYGYIAG